MFNVAVGMPGPFELIIILAIVLILFGAGKLPKVLGQMGKGVKAFKEGLSGQGEEEDDAVDVTPEEGDEPQKAIAQETASSTAEDAEEVVEEDTKAEA